MVILLFVQSENEEDQDRTEAIRLTNSLENGILFGPNKRSQAVSMAVRISAALRSSSKPVELRLDCQ